MLLFELKFGGRSGVLKKEDEKRGKESPLI